MSRSSDGLTSDYATVKYNSSGIQQWSARYDGPISSYDESSAVAHDYSGNAYVTGYVSVSPSDTDYATVKYSTCAGTVRIADVPLYYESLQNAYNAAGTSSIIEAQDHVFTGDLMFNQDKSISIDAGFNCSFSDNTGTTTVTGDIVIANGSVTIRSGMIEFE